LLNGKAFLFLAPAKFGDIWYYTLQIRLSK
jgi:hypothetical protein